MLDHYIIEPSTSQFGSPVLLVTKQDGSYRFCIDYRKLNSMTKADSHPLSRSDDCLESLGAAKARHFSSLDLQSGACVTFDGLYHCNGMSFGLINAPSVFSRLTQIVLGAGFGSGSNSEDQGPIAWKYALIYLDDVIIFSQTFQEHLDRLRLVFDRFRLAKLTLKPSKCCFGKKRIKFLGHYVS